MNHHTLSQRICYAKETSKQPQINKKNTPTLNKINIINMSKEKNIKCTSNFITLSKQFASISSRNLSKPKMLPTTKKVPQKNLKNNSIHPQNILEMKKNLTSNNFMMFLNLNKNENFPSTRVGTTTNAIKKMNYCKTTEDYAAFSQKGGKLQEYSNGCIMNSSLNRHGSKETAGRDGTNTRQDSQKEVPNIISVNRIPQKIVEKVNKIRLYSKQNLLSHRNPAQLGISQVGHPFQKLRQDSIGIKKPHVNRNTNLNNFFQKSNAIFIKNFQNNKVVPNKNMNKMLMNFMSNSVQGTYPEYNLTSSIDEMKINTTSNVPTIHQPTQPTIQREVESDENEEDQDEVKESSGVLTYDEVKDIIVSHDFKNVEKNDRCLFYANDYEEFNLKNKKRYMDVLFPVSNDGNNANEINVNNNTNNIDMGSRSASTKDSSSNKKNYISVIKLK